jgi:hypothetical protein
MTQVTDASAQFDPPDQSIFLPPVIEDPLLLYKDHGDPFDSALDAGLAEKALEAFLDQATGDSVVEEAAEALALIDMVDPEKPLSEELSPERIHFLRNLSQEVLDCMENLRTGAQASLRSILSLNYP